MGVDDPVGAISVHGVNGLWGVLSVGIFANGKYGLGFNGVERAAYDKNPAVLEDGVRGILFGDASQLMAQLCEVATVAIFGFAMAYVWFKLSDFITPLQVNRKQGRSSSPDRIARLPRLRVERNVSETEFRQSFHRRIRCSASRPPATYKNSSGYRLAGEIPARLGRGGYAWPAPKSGYFLGRSRWRITAASLTRGPFLRAAAVLRRRDAVVEPDQGFADCGGAPVPASCGTLGRRESMAVARAPTPSSKKL
jgi:hypothetical protein